MKRRGFTLIELLVTIVLFSLLLGTALYSFRFISINIRNINNTNPQKAINYDLLRGVFNSIYCYIDSDSEELDIDKKFYFYFYGEANKCRFITKSSLFYKEIALGQLRYENDELWYEESKIFDKSIDYRSLDTIKMEKKVLILKGIKEMKFIYKFNNQSSSELRKKIPQLVSITFKDKLKEYEYSFCVKSNKVEELERLKFNRKEFLR
ncbi:MAG TPA: type II secretion system protein [Arcobacter sp.]|nr:type II secretion system protein [Arcobacter sp.]